MKRVVTFDNFSVLPSLLIHSIMEVDQAARAETFVLRNERQVSEEARPKFEVCPDAGHNLLN